MERKYVITVTTTNRFLITVELEKDGVNKIKSNRFKDIIPGIKQQKKDVKLAIMTLIIYVILLSIGIIFNVNKIIILAAFISLFSCINTLLLSKLKILNNNRSLFNWLITFAFSAVITSGFDYLIHGSNGLTILGNILTAMSLAISIFMDIYKDIKNNIITYSISRE